MPIRDTPSAASFSPSNDGDGSVREPLLPYEGNPAVKGEIKPAFWKKSDWPFWRLAILGKCDRPYWRFYDRP